VADTKNPLGGPVWLAALGGAAFCVLAGLIVAGQAELVAADAALSTAAYGFGERHPGGRSAAARLSHLGNAGVVLAVLGWAAGSAPPPRRWRSLAFAGAAMTASSLLRRAVRATLGRDRPIRRVRPARGYAFPSGHATRAATGALVVVLLRWRELSGPRRAFLLALMAGWPVAVGASRVVLVVHWPSDVVGGWLVALTAVPAVAVARGLPIGPGGHG
jgi:membrane-associated phospholipid phosphatase